MMAIGRVLFDFSLWKDIITILSILSLFGCGSWVLCFVDLDLGEEGGERGRGGGKKVSA